MDAEITTRVVLTDAFGRHVATVERTMRKSVGDNPRLFIQELMPASESHHEETVITALRAWDRDAWRHEESEGGSR